MKMITDAEIQKLAEIKIVVKRGKKKFDLNAYSVIDITFLKWVEAELGGVSNSNRLKFRLAVLGILKKLRIKGAMKKVITEDARKTHK